MKFVKQLKKKKIGGNQSYYNIESKKINESFQYNSYM